MISRALAARGSLTGEALIEVRPWAGLPVLPYLNSKLTLALARR
jgi:hypothetical protein